jgi:Flp pilus assembly protein TadG
MRAHNTSIDRRRGATMVESAIILPILFLFLFGIIIGGLGIINYQQVAMLAREGARYASVHGGQYALDNNLSAATPQTVYDVAILPKAVGLEGALTYSVTWTDDSKMPVYLASSNPDVWRRNNVTVTVDYAWTPLMIFTDATLSSTSVMPVSY